MFFYEIRLLQEFINFCDEIGVRTPADSIVFLKNAFSSPVLDKFFRSPEKWPNPDLFELMALAQHHGVPTRLLDWSRHPYAAAYFAASSALPKYENWTSDSRLAIWILDTERLGLFGGRIEVIRPPRSMTPHLVAQSGLFTIQTQAGDRGQVLTVKGLQAEFVKARSSPLLQLTLPVTESVKLYEMCQAVGINAASMYRSADGAAKAVQESVWSWQAQQWLIDHGA